jgi:hypothetical protein
MTNEEAIKFLKQLYPYGGHCWLDEQRIEAIGMAVKALQEEPQVEESAKTQHVDKTCKENGDSLTQEQNLSNVERIGKNWKVSVTDDLDAAIDTYLATYFGSEQEKQEWLFLKKMAIYFANWQKEQLLAKAVDAVVKIDAGGYPYVDRTIELYDYDKDIPLAKNGDKVKIIVIRES